MLRQKLRKKLPRIVLAQTLACTAILASGIYNSNKVSAEEQKSAIVQGETESSNTYDQLLTEFAKLKELKLEERWTEEIVKFLQDKEGLGRIDIESFSNLMYAKNTQELKAKISELNIEKGALNFHLEVAVRKAIKARDEKKFFVGTSPLDKSPEVEQAGDKAEISQEKQIPQNAIIVVPIKGITSAEVKPLEGFDEGLQIPVESETINKEWENIYVKGENGKTSVDKFGKSPIVIFPAPGMILPKANHEKNEFNSNKILVLNVKSRINNLNVDGEGRNLPTYVVLRPESKITDLKIEGDNTNIIVIDNKLAEIVKGKMDFSTGTQVIEQANDDTLAKLLTEYKNSIYDNPETRSAITYVKRHNWKETPKEKFNEVGIGSENGKTVITTVQYVNRSPYISHTYIPQVKVTDKKDVDPNAIPCINFNGKNKTDKAIVDTKGSSMLTIIEIEEDAEIGELCIAEGNDNVALIVKGRALKDAINKNSISQNFRGIILENADNKTKEILISAFKSSILTAPFTVITDKEKECLYIVSGSICGKAAIKITTLEGEQELIVNNYPTLYASQILLQAGRPVLMGIGRQVEFSPLKLYGQPGYEAKLVAVHYEGKNDLYWENSAEGPQFRTSYKGEDTNLVRAKLDLLVNGPGALKYRVKVPVDILEVSQNAVCVKVHKSEETILEYDSFMYKTKISTKNVCMEKMGRTSDPNPIKGGGAFGPVTADRRQDIFMDITRDQSRLDIDGRNHAGRIYVNIQSGVEIGRLCVKGDNVSIIRGLGVKIGSEDILIGSKVKSVQKDYGKRPEYFGAVDTRKNVLRKDFTTISIPVPLLNMVPIPIPTGIYAPFEGFVKGVILEPFADLHSVATGVPADEMRNIWANEMTDTTVACLKIPIEFYTYAWLYKLGFTGVISAANTPAGKAFLSLPGIKQIAIGIRWAFTYPLENYFMKATSKVKLGMCNKSTQTGERAQSPKVDSNKDLTQNNATTKSENKSWLREQIRDFGEWLEEELIDADSLYVDKLNPFRFLRKICGTHRFYVVQPGKGMPSKKDKVVNPANNSASLKNAQENAGARETEAGNLSTPADKEIELLENQIELLENQNKELLEKLRKVEKEPKKCKDGSDITKNSLTGASTLIGTGNSTTPVDAKLFNELKNIENELLEGLNELRKKIIKLGEYYTNSTNGDWLKFLHKYQGLPKNLTRAQASELLEKFKYIKEHMPNTKNFRTADSETKKIFKELLNASDINKDPSFMPLTREDYENLEGILKNIREEAWASFRETGHYVADCTELIQGERLEQTTRLINYGKDLEDQVSSRFVELILNDKVTAEQLSDKWTTVSISKLPSKADLPIEEETISKSSSFFEKLRKFFDIKLFSVGGITIVSIGEITLFAIGGITLKELGIIEWKGLRSLSKGTDVTKTSDKGKGVEWIKRLVELNMPLFNEAVCKSRLILYNKDRTNVIPPILKFYQKKFAEVIKTIGELEKPDQIWNDGMLALVLRIYMTDLFRSGKVKDEESAKASWCVNNKSGEPVEEAQNNPGALIREGQPIYVTCEKYGDKWLIKSEDIRLGGYNENSRIETVFEEELKEGETRNYTLEYYREKGEKGKAEEKLAKINLLLKCAKNLNPRKDDIFGIYTGTTEKVRRIIGSEFEVNKLDSNYKCTEKIYKADSKGTLCFWVDDKTEISSIYKAVYNSVNPKRSLMNKDLFEAFSKTITDELIKDIIKKCGNCYLLVSATNRHIDGDKDRYIVAVSKRPPSYGKCELVIPYEGNKDKYWDKVSFTIDIKQYF